MLMDYLGQVATHKKKIGANTYNEPMFEEKEIACRIVDKFEKVSNDKGEIVVSSGIVQCVDFIKVGDFIGERKIIAVNTMTSLDGIIGYKGYLL